MANIDDCILGELMSYAEKKLKRKAKAKKINLKDWNFGDFPAKTEKLAAQILGDMLDVIFSEDGASACLYLDIDNHTGRATLAVTVDIEDCESAAELKIDFFDFLGDAISQLQNDPEGCKAFAMRLRRVANFVDQYADDGARGHYTEQPNFKEIPTEKIESLAKKLEATAAAIRRADKTYTTGNFRVNKIQNLANMGPVLSVTLAGEILLKGDSVEDDGRAIAQH